MRIAYSLKNIAGAVALLAVGVFIGTAYGESRAQAQIPHGPLSSFEWVDLPEFGGREAIIYRSPDGKRVAAAAGRRARRASWPMSNGATPPSCWHSPARAATGPGKPTFGTTTRG